MTRLIIARAKSGRARNGTRRSAFFEYVLQVPANRWGNSVYSATQLKIIQEVITLIVFCGFAIFYLGEKIKWNHLAAFVCILAAVAFTFLPKE